MLPTTCKGRSVMEVQKESKNGETLPCPCPCCTPKFLVQTFKNFSARRTNHVYPSPLNRLQYPLRIPNQKPRRLMRVGLLYTARVSLAIVDTAHMKNRHQTLALRLLPIQYVCPLLSISIPSFRLLHVAPAETEKGTRRAAILGTTCLIRQGDHLFCVTAYVHCS